MHARVHRHTFHNLFSNTFPALPLLFGSDDCIGSGCAENALTFKRPLRPHAQSCTIWHWVSKYPTLQYHSSYTPPIMIGTRWFRNTRMQCARTMTQFFHILPSNIFPTAPLLLESDRWFRLYMECAQALRARTMAQPFHDYFRIPPQWYPVF